MAKVVLADDEATNRMVHKSLLEKEGHEVHVFTNGLEALTYIQKNKADIVIADLTMPIMDGVELLQNLRHYPLKKVLSSGAYSSILELKKNYGEVECDLYIQKPINLDDFPKRISELLAK